MSGRFHLSMWGAFGVVVLSAFAGPAAAHSFDVDIVFGQSTPAMARAGFLDAFRQASAERDAHANEESDGHLGGLDVYSNMTVLGGGAADLTGAFIVFAGGDLNCDGLVADQGSIVIDAGQAAGAADAAGYRADYKRRYGSLPDDLALSGYLVARQIDAVVRPLGGAGDLAAMRQGISGLCN